MVCLLCIWLVFCFLQVIGNGSTDGDFYFNDAWQWFLVLDVGRFGVVLCYFWEDASNGVKGYLEYVW